MLKYYIMSLTTWENASPKGLIGLNPLKNQPGQSISKRESGFTGFFRLSESLFLWLLCVRWWGWSWFALLSIFNEIGRHGNLSSVVIVWFGSQTWEVIISAYQDHLDQSSSRDRMQWEKGQRENQDERDRLVELLRNHGVAEDKIRKEMNGACSSSKDR